MVNRERFMLDVDSEGFPIADHTPFHHVLAVANIGRIENHIDVQAMLADTKCLPCKPVEGVNPRGWNEVDGVPLPTITWAEERAALAAPVDAPWVAETRAIVQAADLCMMSNHDGITRLSDNYAPDAYYGWKR